MGWFYFYHFYREKWFLQDIDFELPCDIGYLLYSDQFVVEFFHSLGQFQSLKCSFYQYMLYHLAYGKVNL